MSRPQVIDDQEHERVHDKVAAIDAGLRSNSEEITASGSGNAIRIEGHGSWTDTDGQVFTIAIVVDCSSVNQ